MANFSTGVKAYIKAQAVVTVSFPVDLKGNADICCVQCKYFRSSIRCCGLNGEICEYPQKYIGTSCPLVPIEEDDL